MEENKQGNDLYAFLLLIQERTYMYVGSEELYALKSFIHGYLQGLFQNKIAEVSFPKYRWFSAWVKGRINSEFTLDYGWENHIQSATGADKKAAMNLFYQLYKEFVESDVVCHYQKLSSENKIFEDTPHGVYWKALSDSVSELLLFELCPSKTAWCLFLNEEKRIMHTMTGENKLALSDRISNQYFKIANSDWMQFDGKFYLKDLVITRPENNY